MQMCSNCDRVYDESEYSRCPYCSGKLEEEHGERYFKRCPNCGGIMYWEAGNPGGLFGRNTYEFITEIAFNYSFWIIGFSFVLSLGLFWYNLIALNISINKKLSLENNYKESKVDNEINLEKK